MEQFTRVEGVAAPLLRDHTRAVRLAAATRLVTAAKELKQSEFRQALEDAIEEFRAGQQMHLDRASAHLNLALLASRLDNPRQAIAELRLAIEREPYLTGPRSELALLLSGNEGDQGEIDQLRHAEIDLLTRDAGLLPDQPGPLYRRAMLQYLVGELDDARRSLIAACRLGPNDYQSWLALALICEKQGRWKQAVSALERLSQLAPNDPTPQVILQRIEQAMEMERGGERNESPPNSAPQQPAADAN